MRPVIRQWFLKLHTSVCLEPRNTEIIRITYLFGLRIFILTGRKADFKDHPHHQLVFEK